MCGSSAVGANDGLEAVAGLVEGLVGVDLLEALVAYEALLVEVLLLEDEIGLIGRYDRRALGALLALLAREALAAVGLLALVRVDARADQLRLALRAHQTVVVVLGRLERHDRVEYGLRALGTSTRVLHQALAVTRAAARLAVQLEERLLLERLAALAAHEAARVVLLLVVDGKRAAQRLAAAGASLITCCCCCCCCRFWRRRRCRSSRRCSITLNCWQHFHVGFVHNAVVDVVAVGVG